MAAKLVLIECEFLIPVRRDANLSDGKRHSTETWQWLWDELYDQFSGLTIAPGDYEGVYKDPDTGRPVRDRCRKYILAIARRDIDQLRLLLAEACHRFCHKCIYLSVGGRVEFVREVTK